MTQTADSGGRYLEPLREAVELLDEVLPYVPEYFLEKWEFDARLRGIKATLPPNDSLKLGQESHSAEGGGR